MNSKVRAAGDRIVRTRLHNVAAEWARHSRDPSCLYGGSLLEAATETAAGTGADPGRNPPLSHTERDFLHASDRARRRTARWRYAVIAGLLVLTPAPPYRHGPQRHRERGGVQPGRHAAGDNGAVRLWDTATGQPVGTSLPAGSGSANGVAFSPGGKLLASADYDGAIRLWDVALLANPYATLCTDVGPPTRQEWDQYTLGEAFPRICA